jgi:hypothetical protein
MYLLSNAQKCFAFAHNRHWSRASQIFCKCKGGAFIFVRVVTVSSKTVERNGDAVVFVKARLICINQSYNTTCYEKLLM